MAKDTKETWEQEQARKRSEAKTALHAKIEGLKAAQVAQVDCEFSGYGDEGNINSITYQDADENDISADSIPKDIQPTHDEFYELIPGGYDQNEGSSGHIYLDVKEGTIRVDIGWNVIHQEVETFEV